MVQFGSTYVPRKNQDDYPAGTLLEYKGGFFDSKMKVGSFVLSLGPKSTTHDCVKLYVFCKDLMQTWHVDNLNAYFKVVVSEDELG